MIERLAEALRATEIVFGVEPNWWEDLAPRLLAALNAEGVHLVSAETLAAATAAAWRGLWVESAGAGWHSRVWLDVIRPFEDGTVAAAILAALPEEGL